MTSVVVLLSACSGEPEVPELPEQEATWMQGAYFNWDLFNHRLSYLHFDMNDAGGLDAAVVGGTSTTGQNADLDDGCERGSCLEFPASDQADIRVGWGRLTTSAVGLGTGRAQLEVSDAGETATIEVPLPAGATGDVTAVLRGFALDTNNPLDGDPACYRPEYGWHPRHLEIGIESVTLQEGTAEQEWADASATVEVRARFAPGVTEDKDRICIDEVVDRARVRVMADVLVVAGHGGVADEVVSSGETYPFGGDRFNPEPQEEATAAPVGVTGELIGWSSVDFEFNPDSEAGRGVYLRSWGFEVGEAGAVGISTNFSPITQLHDMAYTFDGTVRAVTVDGTVQTGTVESVIDVRLNTDLTPMVFQLPLE
ncbi:MAG: hypothetical protein KTR31_37995 [Myxococcales bacterium]|nr:hypothetical protein [Myxococcales bacterium]